MFNFFSFDPSLGWGEPSQTEEKWTTSGASTQEKEKNSLHQTR
jgi:hypothetical protein